MERQFKILDTTVHLEGPAATVEPIVSAYARFVADDGTDAQSRVAYNPDAPATITINDRTVPTLPNVDPTLQLYRQFLTAVLGGIESHAVLHGAALVSDKGEGLLIAAPAGHGKSSLALGMLDRGFGFLSDDYAPLDLETRKIQPYPRAVALMPGGGAPLAGDFLEAASDPSTPRLFGKSLIDVGRIRGEEVLASAPVELRHLVILVPARESLEIWNHPTWLDVGCTPQGFNELDAAFVSTPGVDVVEKKTQEDLHFWRIRLQHDKLPTRALAPLLDSPEVIYLEKYWDLKPQFDHDPEALEIKRRTAAQLLGREILNRSAGVGILKRYHGDLTSLFVDLAGSLRKVNCWRIVPGGFNETADLIKSLVGYGSHREI